MKTVQFDTFGAPDEVAECVEVEDPGAPQDNEVSVEVEAFPINPVDLLTLSGRYAVIPDLPAIPGSEGVGRVTAVGKGVAQLAPGDRVLLLGRENWTQRKRLAVDQVLKLPDADVLQLAMLKINPATAQLMLRSYVDLQPGDWVLQDAANSGVGTNLIRLAQQQGLRTVNVVRRRELVEPLLDIGAEVVLVDGADLPHKVAEATGGADISLAIDAVAGEICDRLAAALAEGGTIVNYGLLSGRPCTVSPYHVVFRGISLTGFWLVKHLARMSHHEVQTMFTELADKVADGTLYVEVEQTYPIEEIKTALAHAARRERAGKVLVTPNGPVVG